MVEWWPFDYAQGDNGMMEWWNIGNSFNLSVSSSVGYFFSPGPLVPLSPCPLVCCHGQRNSPGKVHAPCSVLHALCSCSVLRVTKEGTKGAKVDEGISEPYWNFQTSSSLISLISQF